MAQVVLEEAGTRKVIFSTFDPDCATLLSLKQPRFPGELNAASPSGMQFCRHNANCRHHFAKYPESKDP